jgi:protein involved in temperature-dependent protein secretion
MDLTTPAGTREFLLLCLDGRRKRTAAQLARVMQLQPTFADAVDQHAPEIAVLRRRAETAQTAAEKAKAAADRARSEYGKALESWARASHATSAGGAR